MQVDFSIGASFLHFGVALTNGQPLEEKQRIVLSDKSHCRSTMRSRDTEERRIEYTAQSYCFVLLCILLPHVCLYADVDVYEHVSLGRWARIESIGNITLYLRQVCTLSDRLF